MFDTLTRMGSSGAAPSYKIDRSLRFDSAASAYLTWDPSSAGNRRTWTISFWTKLSAIDHQHCFFSIGPNSTNRVQFMCESDGRLNLETNNNSSSASCNLLTNIRFTDVSTWYHIVVKLDTEQGTASNRAKIFVNGVNIADHYGTATYPAEDDDLYLGLDNGNAIHIGKRSYSSNYLQGYMAEFHYIDGTALDADSFGETDSDTGQWIPKEYEGSHGSNGCYLKFSDNSGTGASELGADSSGNSNNWTLHNFSVASGEGNDSVTDTPTSNFCTWNAGDSRSGSISNGGLTFKDGAGAVYQAHGTIATPDINGHKYYFEARVAQGYAVGIAPLELSGADNETSRTGTYVVYSNGKKYAGTTATNYTGSWSSATVIGVAIGEGKIKFFKAGNDEGDAFTGLSGPYKPYAWAAGATLTGVELNCGQQPFQYTPPTGYVALCNANLPDSTIKTPTDYFDTTLYTANGSTQSITSLNFQPDLVWVKKRTGSVASNCLTDSVRGTHKKLNSDLTYAENDQTSVDKGMTAFLSNGFTVKDDASGNYEQNGQSGHTFVAWTWKNSVSAGFDIVGYEGDGNNSRNIAHDLGVSPGLIFVKDRDVNSVSSRWTVLHSYDTSKNLELDQTSAAFSHQSRGSITAISSSNFTLYGSTDNVTVNENGDNYIAYVWANVEGYCRIGKYTGNGDSDGTFVYTGFRPCFLLQKRADSGDSWHILDNKRSPFNTVDDRLYPNSNSEESTSGDRADFLSNGFKLKDSNGDFNASGGTYIYMAIAEQSFKYANAR